MNTYRDHLISNGYKMRKVAVLKWFWLGFQSVQLGFHVHLGKPNVELHVPFGFLKFGFEEEVSNGPVIWKQGAVLQPKEGESA